MLLMNCQLHTTLDLFHPNLHARVTEKQAEQKANHDQHSRSHEFIHMIGQQVMVRNL